MNPFTKKYSPELPFPKKKVEDFLYYFNTFYGLDGVYPIRDVTFDEMVEALHTYKTNPGKLGGAPYNHGEFHGDTVDREHVRDIIFSKELLDKVYGRKYLD